MPARTFINQQGTSNKFWTIEVSGAEHTVHYGRLGTDGQVKTKAFADAAKAAASAEKLIAEKLAKGYTEAGTATPPPAERVEAAQVAATTAALAAYEDAPAPAAPQDRTSGRVAVRHRPAARRVGAGGVAARARRARSGGAVRPQAGGRGHPQGEVAALRVEVGLARAAVRRHAHARGRRVLAARGRQQRAGDGGGGRAQRRRRSSPSRRRARRTPARWRRGPGCPTSWPCPR